MPADVAEADPRWPTPEELAGPGLLAGIAEQTGGREYPVAKLDELPEIAAKIGVALRHQYMLGYAPQNMPHNGEYRKVAVKVMRPTGLERLRIYWRRGYYGPDERANATWPNNPKH